MKDIADVLRHQERSQPLTLLLPKSSTPANASVNADGHGNPNCPLCHGNGFLREDVPLGHPDFGTMQVCECRRSPSTPRLWEMSGLTEREQGYRLTDIVIKDRPGGARLHQALVDYCASPGGILTVHGSVGNGKTLGLQAAVNEMIEAGCAAAYVRVPALVSYWRSQLHLPRAGERDDGDSVFQLVEQVLILAMDDLDQVNVTPWVAEQLNQLLDIRDRLGRDKQAGTLLAMNRDPAELDP